MGHRPGQMSLDHPIGVQANPHSYRHNKIKTGKKRKRFLIVQIRTSYSTEEERSKMIIEEELKQYIVQLRARDDPVHAHWQHTNEHEVAGGSTLSTKNSPRANTSCSRAVLLTSNSPDILWRMACAMSRNKKQKWSERKYSYFRIWKGS